MKYFILLLSFCFYTLATTAQNFDSYFVDKALRIDYIFSGNASSQIVALDQLSQLPQWAGRHNNLSQLVREGNGQIVMTDIESEACIYKDAFSTLFQEWQTTPEAENAFRSFENTFLVPYPKNKTQIEVLLRDRKGKYVTVLKHIVDPADILIKKKGLDNTTPYTVLHQGGDIDKCVNVVVVAEGYAIDEMTEFRQYAKIACEQILAHQPFGKYKGKLNFLAVESVSKHSGVSVPRNNQWRETIFSSHFDTFYSDRYLTTTHVKDVHDALAGIPYGHIIILANTNVYGGGGIFNAYTLTTTGHRDFRPVVVHEFGHSFGGLADEYYYETADALDATYPHDVEPWEPNITTLVDFGTKWSDLMRPKTPTPSLRKKGENAKVDLYEGAGYSSKGVYRPAYDCRMKTNTCEDFCPVCQRAIGQLIEFYTK